MTPRFLPIAIIAALSVILLVRFCMHYHRSGTYTVTDLGLRDSAGTYAYALNDAGQVVGNAEAVAVSGRSRRAFRFGAGTSQPLGDPTRRSDATGINAAGT